MNRTTYLMITIFGGWLGVHRFARKQIGLGILYLFTCGLFCVGWFVDIVIAASQLLSAPKQTTQNSNSEYINSLYYQMNQEMINHQEMRPFIDKYYKGLEEIESMWSVMYNLKIKSGEQADSFENKCYENLADLQNMLQAERKYRCGGDMPPHVPAYVRLAMLYEKQERYNDAINICVEAIKLGAVSDGGKGKMYGRLARIIRKSGLQVDNEVLTLANMT